MQTRVKGESTEKVSLLSHRCLCVLAETGVDTKKISFQSSFSDPTGRLHFPFSLEVRLGAGN